MAIPVLPFFRSLEDPRLESLALAGRVVFEYQKDAKYRQFLQSFEKVVSVVVDVTGANPQLEDVISVLNSGVEAVITRPELAELLVEFGVPQGRLIVDISASGSVLSSFLAYLVGPDQSVDAETVFVDARKSKPAENKYTPLIKAEDLTTQDLADRLIATLVTDRQDGLYTTLVNDVAGRLLGLVYSLKELIREAFKTGTGVYQSRKRGLWYKGASSGATQTLLGVLTDCDGDALVFTVEQKDPGFCHLETATCFGELRGLAHLEKTLFSRAANAPEGSYTKRLFTDKALLSAKIREEADELVEAQSKDDVAWEAADLFYFALVKCVQAGVSLADVERNLDFKSLKVTRRKGDAKPKYIEGAAKEEASKKDAPAPVSAPTPSENDPIHLKVHNVTGKSATEIAPLLERPVQTTQDIMKLVTPIVENVIQNGDKALIELTAKFDKVQLDVPIMKAPFAPEAYALPDHIREALDLLIENVHKFHAAQLQKETLRVETAPGVVCLRFSRPIEKVGLYIPGGTAVLPSTALMLGVPAKAAGCQEIIFASPPRKDGTLTPEVVYVAHKVGAKAIVLAGGAQAVAAMAYGTESVPKCDKIMGPGNQFVTAAKMYVQNDTRALCAIDMPAGPSEVLVIADLTSDPDYVAADLLSQAEHGVDLQVVLVAVDMNKQEIEAVQEAVDRQARALPRVDIIRKCIAHSVILQVDSVEQAFECLNLYAPEHLILQIADAAKHVDKVQHAGSVFVGYLTPELCGDYSLGTNHTLPTYGYARMYLGVNTGTFLKYITLQEVSREGLENIGPAVMAVADVEGLGAHANAVRIRMSKEGLL